MTSPALVALTNPRAFPDEAIKRLLGTASMLTSSSRQARNSGYVSCLGMLGRVAQRAGGILPGLIKATCSEAEMAAVANAERLMRAGVTLFGEVAVRSVQRDRHAAMGWATLSRRGYADITLVHREFAPTAFLGVDWDYNLTRAPIRILPGAEPALVALSHDPLEDGEDWDLPVLATQLARWVLVT